MKSAPTAIVPCSFDVTLKPGEPYPLLPSTETCFWHKRNSVISLQPNTTMERASARLSFVGMTGMLACSTLMMTLATGPRGLQPSSSSGG